MRTPEAAKLATINDRFRQSFIGGYIFTTPGVRGLSSSTRASVLAAVRGFDDFSEDNDPYGEHDFGAVQIDGKKYFWKIDYYDATYERGSPNPLDLSVTRRVLTVMRADEY